MDGRRLKSNWYWVIILKFWVLLAMVDFDLLLLNSLLLYGVILRVLAYIVVKYILLVLYFVLIVYVLAVLLLVFLLLWLRLFKLILIWRFERLEFDM